MAEMIVNNYGCGLWASSAGAFAASLSSARFVRFAWHRFQ